jgi:hypothetical protein
MEYDQNDRHDRDDGHHYDGRHGSLLWSVSGVIALTSIRLLAAGGASRGFGWFPLDAQKSGTAGRQDVGGE